MFISEHLQFNFITFDDSTREPDRYCALNRSAERDFGKDHRDLPVSDDAFDMWCFSVLSRTIHRA